MPVCRGCGNSLERYQSVCPQCSTVVEAPGFFRQVWEGLCGLFGRLTTSRTEGAIRSTMRTQTVELIRTGRSRTYSSMEELPPEMRAQVEQLLQSRGGTGLSSKIVVEDENGQRREYASWDEVPAEIRARMEAAGFSPPPPR